MSETLDLSGLYPADAELLRGLAARMRKVRELDLPAVLRGEKPKRKLSKVYLARTTRNARQIDAAIDVGLAEPAPTKWCDQCDRRVADADVARCLSKWCGPRT